MEVTLHRFVLAELNTHRAFSRNSASSRAIPIQKQIEKIVNSPAFPVEFGSNQAGMQAGPPLEGKALRKARKQWGRASRSAIRHTKKLQKLGVHKQVANRLLEPFMWHTVIISSTEWENFFIQRCSPLAQPEIRAAADLMRVAYDLSTPKFLSLGEWHLPYIDDKDKWAVERIVDITNYDNVWKTLCKISAARCARVSYLTQNGVRDVTEDIKMYDRLVSADPPHWSPLEHVATPAASGANIVSTAGNFIGFAQLRHNIEVIK